MHRLYQRLTGQAVPPAGDCERCQADMAVYIDTLLSAGSSAAAQALPHVWWHIWQCADCAETFELTLALIDAELRGEIMPLESLFKTTEPTRPIWRLLIVRPEMIAHLFTARQVLGMSYGDAEETVVSEEIDANCTFQISMQRAHDEAWSLIVSSEPPLAAMAVFTIGSARYQAPFDEQGRAIVHDISVIELQQADAGISIAIEALD
jgi:hypothetical protein